MQTTSFIFHVFAVVFVYLTVVSFKESTINFFIFFTLTAVRMEVILSVVWSTRVWQQVRFGDTLDSLEQTWDLNHQLDWVNQVQADKTVRKVSASSRDDVTQRVKNQWRFYYVHAWVSVLTERNNVDLLKITRA
jgi:hypothetical protein